MAQVTLTVGDRDHIVGCRDGEEDRLRVVAAMLDERWPGAKRAAGAAGPDRAMLFVALMLADDLDEAVNRPAKPVADEPTLARLADRLERLAQALEDDAPSA